MVEVGNFKFIETKIPDLYIVEPKVFGDARSILSISKLQTCSFIAL